MSQHKYVCPHCGQKIEYTDGYAGRQMPCPMCQQPIVFPGLASFKTTSSLRLQRDIPKPVQQAPPFFAALAAFVRDFKHWGVVGFCVIPFAVVAAALIVASRFNTGSPSPDPAATPIVVDPKALPKLTELTRADMVVQDKLAAVKAAYQSCQTAKHNHADEAILKRNDDSLMAAHKAFDLALANYEKLGGKVDYRSQLPSP